MQQNPRPFHVAEETITNANPFVGAFNQAGNIGDDEATTIDPGHPKIGVQGCERIVCDFWFCSADRCKKCRFSRVRQSDYSGIGNQFKTQPDRALIGRQARIGPVRCLIG